MFPSLGIVFVVSLFGGILDIVVIYTYHFYCYFSVAVVPLL